MRIDYILPKIYGDMMKPAHCLFLMPTDMLSIWSAAIFLLKVKMERRLRIQFRFVGKVEYKREGLFIQMTWSHLTKCQVMYSSDDLKSSDEYFKSESDAEKLPFSNAS